MKGTEKLPLARRLRETPGTAPTLLPAFGLYGEDYCAAASDLTGRPFFREYHEKELVPMYEKVGQPLRLCEIVAKLREDYPPEGAEIPLIALLITPFALMEEGRDNP